MISAHRFCDSHPTASFALFRIHDTIDPKIPGNAAPAFCANLLNRFASAFSLFFIHSLAPSLPFGVLPPPDDAAQYGNKASTRTPIAIPIAVKIETIVTPCSLNNVLILSAKEPVSLSKNFTIDSFI